MLRVHSIMCVQTRYQPIYRTSLQWHVHVPAHVAHRFQADNITSNQSRVGEPVQVGCVRTDLHRSQAGSVYRIRVLIEGSQKTIY